MDYITEVLRHDIGSIERVEQLSEEIIRLNRELMFANNCLNVLFKFKALLSEICVKFETIIASEDKQQFNRLEEELNYVTKSRQQLNETTVKTEINELLQKSSEEPSKTETIQKTITVRRVGTIRRKPTVKLGPKAEVQSEINSLTKSKTKSKQKTSESNSGNENPSKDYRSIDPNNETKAEVQSETTQTVRRLRTSTKKPVKYTTKEPSVWAQRYTLDPNTQMYVCPHNDCPKSYKNRDLFRSHYKTVHLKTRTPLCDHPNCGKGFKTLNGLKKHLVIHKTDKPFVCPVSGCKYRTKSKHCLDQHSIKHSEERQPLSCSQCQKTFKTETGLQEHIKTHHSSGPAFKCRFEACGRAFLNSNQLKLHRMIDHKSKYRCEWPGCEYEATSSSRFIDHKGAHTGEKRHSCEWPGCGKQFRTIELKYKHKLIHKNEMRYACDWPGCDYRANVSDYLKQHKKWSHKS